MIYYFYFNCYKIAFMLLDILVLYLYDDGNNFSKAFNIIDNYLYFITFLAQISRLS